MEERDGLTYQMPLEVYLQDAVIRGMLVTNQERLSNHLILRNDDEVVSLRSATLQAGNPKAAPLGSDEYLVYLQSVFMIADLSPNSRSDTSAFRGFYVRKDSSAVLLNVGPYMIQGRVHTLPGDPLHELLISRTRFFPVTDATLIDRVELGSRTYLVNRTKIGFLTALKDDLREL
jgi:hypothetical protein